MNKIVIPTILAATVLVAGIFAMMPVQKATTVHTGLTTAIGDLDSDGVPNGVDNCPLAANPGQVNSDFPADPYGDVCDSGAPGPGH